MTRRRWLWLSAAALVLLAALTAVRFGPALTLSLALALPRTEAWPSPFIQAVVREEVRIPHAGRPLVADLYRPARPRGAFLLVHGLSAAGRRQPDLARLAHLLARHGRLVLVPQFEGLAAFRLGGDEVPAIVTALDHLATRGLPVAIAGFSFGAGPALLAAAERPAVRLAASFGGYADLRAVIAFITTGASAEPYNRWKLLQMLVGFVGDARDREVLDAIARARLANPSGDTSALEAALGEEGRAVLVLVMNRRADAVGPLLERLAPGARRALERLSPLPAMARLRGRVLVAHGREDISIPYTESVRLAAAAGTRAMILETFHHTGPRSLLDRVEVGAGDAWRLVGLADGLLAVAD